MKVMIKVEQRHIDAGVRESSVACPIALAAKSAGLPGVVVGCGALTADSFPYRYWFSDTAREFIKAFDHGEPVQPFEFEIEVPA